MPHAGSRPLHAQATVGMHVASSQVKGWLQRTVAKVGLKFQPKTVEAPGCFAHTEDRRVRKYPPTKGNDMDPTMAQRLVDRRKAVGLSQEALADKLGVSRQAVSKWERSESSPTPTTLSHLQPSTESPLTSCFMVRPHSRTRQKRNGRNPFPPQRAHATMMPANRQRSRGLQLSYKRAR